MNTIVSIKPLFAVLVSLLVVPFIILSSRAPNVRESWTFAAALLKFFIVVSMLPLILSGIQLE
jgi:multicomponent Na+:H+ antiporter subunit D